MLALDARSSMVPVGVELAPRSCNMQLPFLSALNIRSLWVNKSIAGLGVPAKGITLSPLAAQ